jgi:ketosteroid isomerase-like protein
LDEKRFAIARAGELSGDTAQVSESDFEVIREQYRATNERDWERSISLWAEDAVLDVRAGGIRSGVFEGREVIVRWFTEWFTTFADDASFDLLELMELDDGSILAVSEHRATGRGSGIELTSGIVWRYFVKDGRIVRQVGHRDREDAVAAAARSSA